MEFIFFDNCFINTEEVAAIQFFIYKDGQSRDNAKVLFKNGQGITLYGDADALVRLRDNHKIFMQKWGKA